MESRSEFRSAGFRLSLAHLNLVHFHLKKKRLLMAFVICFLCVVGVVCVLLVSVPVTLRFKSYTCNTNGFGAKTNRHNSISFFLVQAKIRKNMCLSVCQSVSVSVLVCESVSTPESTFNFLFTQLFSRRILLYAVSNKTLWPYDWLTSSQYPKPSLFSFWFLTNGS